MKKFTIIIIFAITLALGTAGYAEMDNTKWAEGIMYSVRQYAEIYEEGDHLVVEFHEFVHPYCPTSRHKLITMIADADCTLTGKARTIFFYNPGGKQMAQADQRRGIRLID